MALTTSATRSARPQRVTNTSEASSSTTRRAKVVSSTVTSSTIVTSTQKTIASSSSSRLTKKSKATVSISSTSKSTKTIMTRSATAAATVHDLSVFFDDEKENIDPLTGLDPLETQALKTGKSKVFGSSAMNTNTSLIEDLTKPVTKARTRVTKARISESIAPASEIHIDTVTGRVLASNAYETAADRRARELTVRPLVDLSEAFGIIKTHASTSKDAETGPTTQSAPEQTQSTIADEKDEDNLSVYALVASELDAALRVLALTTDEQRRLPTVLQRSRGVKRALHSPATSGFTTSTSSDKASIRRLSAPAPVASNSRPTKRMRRSAPGTETPTFEPTQDDALSFPPVPPNSPARSKRDLPSFGELIPPTSQVPTAMSFPTLSFVLPASASVAVPVPSAPEEQTEETQDCSFDTSQGSSHFSSIFGSFRSSLGSVFHNNSSRLTLGDEDEEDAGSSSWSRWL